jgi:tRNA pseudouridine38-40 synthase
MVRTIVGTMVDIGKKRTSLDEFRQIIGKKDRRLAGAAAPACGLILTNVEYPGDIFVK